jgi:hypothetical protein
MNGVAGQVRNRGHIQSEWLLDYIGDAMRFLEPPCINAFCDAAVRPPVFGIG